MPSVPPRLRRQGFLTCLGAEAGVGLWIYVAYDFIARSPSLTVPDFSELVLGFAALYVGFRLLVYGLTTDDKPSGIEGPHG